MWPWLAFALLLAPSLAHAHGAAPRALAPLLREDAGVTLVRLSLGLARRSADGFEFVCPALWGGDESAPSLSAASRAAVATRDGLWWLQDGAPRASDVPLAGAPVALASANDGLLVLLALDGGWAISSAEGRQLWSAREGELAETSWLAIDADAQRILLAGTREGVLEQLLLDGDGGVLSHESEPLLSAVLSLEAHLTREGPYLTVASDDGQFTLGHFDTGWHALASGNASLAGPVESAEGLLVSIDGVLNTLRQQTLTALPRTEPVSALARLDGASFASVRDGLCTLVDAGCTERVFDFAQLRGPALDALSPALRDACEAEWEHMQVDLSAAGLLPATDAGSATMDAGVDAGVAAIRLDAGAVDAGSAPLAEARDAGCQLHGHAHVSLLYSALGLICATARRRRSRKTR